MDIFAVLCSDGAIVNCDDVKQCEKEKWLPVAAIIEGNKTTVLLFCDLQVAVKFIKRNYSKDWTRGIINLTTTQLKWMNDQGWESRVLTFPQILKDIPGFGYAILEFQDEMDIKIRG